MAKKIMIKLCKFKINNKIKIKVYIIHLLMQVNNKNMKFRLILFLAIMIKLLILKQMNKKLNLKINNHKIRLKCKNNIIQKQLLNK